MSAHEVMAGLVLTQLVLCSPSAQLILKAQHFPQMPERHCFLIIVYLSYKLCLRDCLRPPIRISEQRKDFIYKRTCFFIYFFSLLECEGHVDLQMELCSPDPLTAVSQSHQSLSQPPDVWL